MNEFKQIEYIKYCSSINDQCDYYAVYQRIFQCGGNPNQGKLVNFKCSNSNNCPTEQCPIYKTIPQLIDW